MTWTSQKQRTVALLSMEAEYMAASSAAREGTWLKNLLNKIRISLPQPLKLTTDNKSSIDF